MPILAAVTLAVNPPTAEPGLPVNVDWTREETDPGHFDLRFILDGEDIGKVATSVFAGESVLSGATEVTFPREGYVFFPGFVFSCERLNSFLFSSA